MHSLYSKIDMVQQMKNIFTKLKNFVCKILFPEEIKCIFCGKDIPNFENKPYCQDCEKTLPFNNSEKRCKICDMEIAGESEVCDICRNHHKAFDKTRAVFKYEGVIRKRIINLKSDKQTFLAKPLASLIAKTLPEDMQNFDVIIPIPLSEKSFKKRGYNQSELLAIEIQKHFQKPLLTNVLIKDKDTKAQKNLSFKERQENMIGVFKIQNRKLIKDQIILLVDDVMTTSATTNVASDILKKFAKKVYVLTIARKTITLDNPKRKLK